MSTKSDPADPTYEVRYGLWGWDPLLIPASTGLLVFGYIVRDLNPLAGVSSMLLGGFYLALRLITLLTRRVVLRVDAIGVTLGALALRPRTHAATVPWSDIEAVVLWQQPAGSTTIRYLGLQRREGLAPLPGSAQSRIMKNWTNWSSPRGVSLQTALDSRPIQFWDLDEQRLAKAISHFAPGVKLVRKD